MEWSWSWSEIPSQPITTSIAFRFWQLVEFAPRNFTWFSPGMSKSDFPLSAVVNWKETLHPDWNRFKRSYFKFSFKALLAWAKTNCWLIVATHNHGTITRKHNEVIYIYVEWLTSILNINHRECSSTAIEIRALEGNSKIAHFVIHILDGRKLQKQALAFSKRVFAPPVFQIHSF